MVRFPRVAVLIAFAALTVGFVHAVDAVQHRKAPAGQREITGRIGAPEMVLRGPVVSVEPNVGFLVIRHGAGKDAEEIPIEIDAKTTLRRGGKSVSLSEVRRGDRVTVHYSGRPGDVSKVVEVAPGAPARAGRPSRRAM
jgi:hypothetical protein